MLNTAQIFLADIAPQRPVIDYKAPHALRGTPRRPRYDRRRLCDPRGNLPRRFVAVFDPKSDPADPQIKFLKFGGFRPYAHRPTLSRNTE